MTTQQKTDAIQNIFANHQDNLAAKNAAHVNPALDTELNTAMSNALKAELEKVFAMPKTALDAAVPALSRKATRGRKTTR